MLKKILLTLALVGALFTVVPQGQGIVRFSRTSQILSINVTPASNVSTSETDLMTYTLPAGWLSANGMGVRVTASFTTAANTNSKNIRLYFGGTLVGGRDGVNLSSSSLKVSGEVFRTGASAQTSSLITDWYVGTTLQNGNYNVLTPAIDTTTAIIIKVTGTSAVASSDVTAVALLIEGLK